MNAKLQKTEDVHPQLYHYTKWEGVKGILENNNLWATNVRYMNDSSEYHIASRFMSESIGPMVRGKIIENSKNNEEVKKYIADNGGLDFQTSKMVRDCIQSLYQVTGEEFYIASFCSTPKDNYTEQNGLLSQWRGYGSDIGFCLVFNTKKLFSMLEKEVEQFYYGPSHLSDVVYSHEVHRFEKELGTDLKTIEEFVSQTLNSIINNLAPPSGTEAMVSFHMVATRIKHQAFDEEQEVRLVAAPTVKKRELVLLYNAANGAPKKTKEIKYRQWKNMSAPYIELFGRDFPMLPIEKIIVGPGKNNSQAEDLIRRLVHDRDIGIHISDMPLV